MTDEKTKQIKLRNNSAPSSTRSNSTGAQKKELKKIIRADFYSMINKLSKGSGCDFIINKITSKYKPLIPQENIIEEDSVNSIEFADEDGILYDSDDQYDISDENKKQYNLDKVNYDENKNDKSSKKKLGTAENENKRLKEIEENINALKTFIQNLKQNQENNYSDIDYLLIIRKDINALVIYIEVNYVLYEYTFFRENQNNFLDEIITLCEEISIIPFH